MRTFRTAARRAVSEMEWIEFPVEEVEERDGETVVVHVQICRALAEPQPGQVAYYMAARSATDEQRMSAFLNLFGAVMDPDTERYFSDRLLDGLDPFGPSDVNDIMGALMEEWSGRPTRQSSDSTQSPRTDGPSSRPTSPESTSSPYPSIVSST